MNISLKIIIAFSACVSLANAMPPKDIVWFPDPNQDGKVIPAILTPPAQGVILGSVEDVHFYLYTKRHPEVYEILFDDMDSIDNAPFISGAPLKFMVHGFGSSYLSHFPVDLKNEFLELNDDFNLILMDWEPLAASPDYFLAYENAQVASQHAAEFIDLLVEKGKFTRDDIHLIGYSLGGQVVGQIGSRLKEKIARIAALDPALPVFDHASDFNRTDPSDAHFVDVIHVAANGFLAYRDPCGHIDWYPNGGGYQPGCGIDPVGALTDEHLQCTCDLESLKTQTGFYGRECEDYDTFLDGSCTGKTEIMGYFTPSNARGVFYLQSNSDSPYAKGPLNRH